MTRAETGNYSISIFGLIIIIMHFIKHRTSGLKTCSEALTRHLVQNKVNIKLSNYAAAKNITK